MQDIENEMDRTQESILAEAELINLVIEKHTKFINEYSSEFAILKEKITLNRSDYQHINKELEALETRIAVLKEKRHQLYHQVKKLRIKLVESIGDNEKVLHIIDEINTIENRLQNTNISSDDEYDHIERMKVLLDEITGITSNDDIKQVTKSSIIDLLETAKMAREELDNVLHTPDKREKESGSLKKDFEEMEPRRDWLNRRIKLHSDARKYWDERKSGVDKS